jgi:hypothetical protein
MSPIAWTSARRSLSGAGIAACRERGRQASASAPDRRLYRDRPGGRPAPERRAVTRYPGEACREMLWRPLRFKPRQR